MSDLFDAARSRALRDQGIEQAGSWPASEWVAKARSFAISWARMHGSVSIDDVNRHCPRPESISPNAAGSIFRTSELEAFGTLQSKKITSHARRVCIYRLKRTTDCTKPV